MYCNKENVNILTALLVKHGIKHAVVCPGSRNTPIINNLNECHDIACYPVTDERSAGFMALGLAQATGRAVAVCVTSGTALLNVAPAAAEATYQHNGIVVISADRPEAWIDQLDGQTMRQPQALHNCVAKSVTLPQPGNEEERWHCNRLVNEALIECNKRNRASVHINVPIGEPLFDFTTAQLPDERKIDFAEAETGNTALLQADFTQAQRPMIVLGQSTANSTIAEAIEMLQKRAVIVGEPIAAVNTTAHAEEILYACKNHDDLMPDFVLYVGDAIVSKRLKQFLRKSQALVWKVGLDSMVHDTFMHLRGIVEGEPGHILHNMAQLMQNSPLPPGSPAYIELWQQANRGVTEHIHAHKPAYSQLMAVRELELLLQEATQHGTWHVHYANSTSIRLACLYAQGHHYVWCNRGINGIEGSVSTAAGFSIASECNTLLVTGDLSFFYDQNALWNQNLQGNLRIVLLNNGGGGIFRQLKGLENGPLRNNLVAASHNTHAQGICEQNHVAYRTAHNEQELRQGVQWLLTPTSHQPMLLEVLTEASHDETAYKNFYYTLYNTINQ